jgi:hypothetical protein
MFIVLLILVGLMATSAFLLVAACVASSRFSQGLDDETARGYAPAAHAYGD